MEQSNKLIEIYAGNNIQAFALKYELEDAGIGCMIRNDQEAGNFLGIGSIQFSVRVLIEEENLEKAKPIVEAFIERNPD